MPRAWRAAPLRAASWPPWCDCDPAKAQLARQQYPAVPFFDEAQALFASGLCDAVIISVPHRFHVPLGIAALAQGLHVLVGKAGGVR